MIVQQFIAAFRDLVLREHVRRRLEADERKLEDGGRTSRGEMISLLAYFAALIVSHGWLDHLRAQWARTLVALLPLPAIVLMVFFVVLRVRRMDELQRRIELTALAIVAMGAWLAAVTCWLLLHGGVNVPPLSAGFLALPLLYELARRWVRRRY